MNSSKKNFIKKYYDSRSACQVLGSLMINPKLIKSLDFPLDKEDFIGGKHQTLFTAIFNLAHQGVETINLSDIESHLHSVNPVGYIKMFEKFTGEEWITSLLEDANVNNFSHYYKIVRKYALLRSYLSEGVDVSKILDLNELDPEINQQQLEIFDKLSIEDIIKFFDRQNLNSKQRFTVRDNNKSRKSGDGADELYEAFKETPSYGLSYESEYLNTITYGVQGNRFIVDTRDSGCGKTRSSIKRLCTVCSPYLWDSDKQQFIENPNGKDNAGLYIGTEMDIYLELEPIIWCTIACVDQAKYKNNELTKEEEQRLLQAIEYSKQMQLYFEDEEDFDINFLWQIIEKHKMEHNICMVCLDYVELNSALAMEYTSTSRGMTSREDQILLNLSKNIKAISKRFDVNIIAYTQTNDEGRKEGLRDQTAVKGGKSFPNKSDFAMTVFEPTKKELELIEPIIRKHSKGINGKIIPNVCYHTYKNRWFNPKKIKIWGYQDLGTNEYKDLFCTDEHYKYINIPKTKIMLKE